MCIFLFKMSLRIFVMPITSMLTYVIVGDFNLCVGYFSICNKNSLVITLEVIVVLVKITDNVLIKEVLRNKMFFLFFFQIKNKTFRFSKYARVLGVTVVSIIASLGSYFVKFILYSLIDFFSLSIYSSSIFLIPSVCFVSSISHIYFAQPQSFLSFYFHFCHRHQ